jgi:internalin A
MQLTVELNKKIIDFFNYLPDIDSLETRKALLNSASLDKALINQVNFNASTKEFVASVVEILLTYGNLEAGRDALEVVLEAAKNFIGIEGQNRAEELIQELRITGKRFQTSSKLAYRQTSKKTILILTANPKDTSRLNLEEELHSIEEGLKLSKNRDKYVIHSKWAFGLIGIRRAILDNMPDIVHFSGHGHSDGLIVVDENGFSKVISPKVLENLFKLFKDQVECVVLNTAYSEKQAKALNKHIPYVIGMNQKVADKAAIEFAVGFYDALGAGRSIEEAFEFGLHALTQMDFSDTAPFLLKNTKVLGQYRQLKIEIIPSRQNILILSANPKNLSHLRLDEEMREIAEGLRRSKFRDKFTLYQKWAVHLEDIKRTILDEQPQVVHFIGHQNEYGLMVEDETGNTFVLTPRSMSKLFKHFAKFIDCVILGACYSEAQASAISEHINYVIGISGQLDDRSRISFSIGFYDALGAGKTVEEAFKFGCNAVQIDNVPNSLIPILKKRPKGLKFSGLEILQQLQKKIGKTLSLSRDNDKDVEFTQNVYTVDENNNVIGLNLSNNHLTALPGVITKLKNLKTFVLTKNQFENFPLELLELSELTILRLGENLLISLPNEVTNLKHLEHLSLNANLFKKLPMDINRFPNLKELDLRNNLLTELPKMITDLNIAIKWDADGNHDGLYLEGNPLEKPPIEIVKYGQEFIKIYFDSMENDYQTVKEVKVLFVGDGGAGKTSLVKKILDEPFNQHEPQTHGININSWYVKNQNSYLKVNLWDFGGQEIMHATHQFFLSKRSLYVLVLDGRKDEDVEYWLKHIRSFGGDSPILVVLNKIDENPAFEVNRRFLQDKYSGIKGFYRMSCSKNIGIKEFSENLIRELSYVEISKTVWPKSWFNVKTNLEKKTENYISYDQYVGMCETEQIIEEANQKKLVGFLNDLGVILHFPESRLFDTHVIKPEWVTTAVYKIINSDQLAQSKGLLDISLLDDILKKKTETDFVYPRDKNLYIIDLMKKFGLCYEIEPDIVLVPDLLDVQEPRFEFDSAQALQFLIEYDFLPKSIMPSFIVKMHKDIKENLCWRTGVVLEDAESLTTAVIKADKRDRKIYIAVHGEQKRDYFAVIRRTLKNINESFKHLEFEEKVPLPDNNQVTVKYQELIGLKKMGKAHIPIGILGKEYAIKQLLDGIEQEEERMEIVSQEGGSTHYHIQKSEVTIGTSTKEVKDMSTKINDRSTKIGTQLNDGSIVYGDVTGVVADKIKNSFNKVDSSNLSDNLKEILKNLTTEVGKISKHLSKEQGEQIANDLQALTNEATSEKPRKKWWELSVEGIKEAAESVGEVGKTALILLKDIIPILTKI